ncbi:MULTISPECIES: 2-dehydropantoate 2-reductase [unclassified Rossellomorea]|uniref:2-dehydropantoate 2-reductase n=1 Tax=unclassified Rossellomorea TaxID=2837526 RepID=UPI0020C6BBA9|nr:MULTISPECIES: 2-dehydropantoate 2-reductase [unclassified Rossellomorea]UTE75299.1 2-dehydropantoate 2-reductase [Rossellomorea sp. KS-H15a]WGG47421.1 2-dehydropantoate 2-reductase [Rossellomorea sp. DA94]
MKIGIIGGGAVGLLFAGYLGRLFDVTLIVRRESQVRSLLENGVTIYKEGSAITTRVGAVQETETEKEFDLVIVAVKEYDLPFLRKELVELGVHVPLLFVQNGIGHVDWVKSLPHRHLVAGSVDHGAMKENDAAVHHLGEAETNIALIRGNWHVIEEIVSKSTDSFRFSIRKDFEKMLLTKLFVNVSINPLTALTGVTNGKLVENPYFHGLQKDLFNEMLLLFPQMKGNISFEKVVDICRNTYQNRSSMLKDIESQRKTEIESIIGVLLDKAQKEHHFVPIMNLLYKLVKGIEREGLGG